MHPVFVKMSPNSTEIEESELGTRISMRLAGHARHSPTAMEKRTSAP